MLGPKAMSLCPGTGGTEMACHERPRSAVNITGLLGAVVPATASAPLPPPPLTNSASPPASTTRVANGPVAHYLERRGPFPSGVERNPKGRPWPREAETYHRRRGQAR